jgi:hypothetical protein
VVGPIGEAHGVSHLSAAAGASATEERRAGPREWAASLAIVLLAVVAANALALKFVGCEKSFLYFWDWARYWVVYIDESSLLRADLLNGLSAAAASIRVEDYNVTPILPLVPVEWIFGSGRLPYVLSIVNILLLPSGLLLALAAWRIQSGRSVVALALATAAILCTHAWWVPALRGLPDVLGVGIIGLVLCVYFSSPLNDQRPIQLVITGLLLCVLALTRRYYIFWIAAFFPAAVVAEFYRIHAAEASPRGAKCAVAVGHLAIVGAVCLCAIVIAAPDLVWRIFRTDYADMYSAYRTGASISGAAGEALDYFGGPLLSLSAAGLMVLASRPRTRHVAAFVIVQVVTIFVLFTHTQDFGVQHYYLLLPALGLGVAALVFGLLDSLWPRLLTGAGVAAIFLALIASSAAVLAPGAGVIGGLLPKARFYPLVRGDLHAVNRLLDRLEQLPGAGKIYVLSSSTILNYSTLQVACRTQDRPKAFCDRILRTHDVDKRDGFPERFLQAAYVVMASPVQYHLRPADQQAVGLLAASVSEGRGVGASFQRLPVEFKLDQGVRVQIYARTSPFQPNDIALLECRFYDSYPLLKAPFERLKCAR